MKTALMRVGMVGMTLLSSFLTNAQDDTGQIAITPSLGIPWVVSARERPIGSAGFTFSYYPTPSFSYGLRYGAVRTGYRSFSAETGSVRGTIDRQVVAFTSEYVFTKSRWQPFVGFEAGLCFTNATFQRNERPSLAGLADRERVYFPSYLASFPTFGIQWRKTPSFAVRLEGVSSLLLSPGGRESSSLVTDTTVPGSVVIGFQVGLQWRFPGGV
ncbi:hypothetical protein [Larkinella harenae]